MLLALVGYIVLVALAFLCAYVSSRRSIEAVTLDVDRTRFFRSMLGHEGFNPSFLINLLFSLIGICCTILPGESPVGLAAAVLLLVINFGVAVFLSDALMDDYTRVDDPERRRRHRFWYRVVGGLAVVTFIVGLARFYIATSDRAVNSPPVVPPTPGLYPR